MEGTSFSWIPPIDTYDFVWRELPFHGSLLSISFDLKKSCYFHTLENEWRELPFHGSLLSISLDYHIHWRWTSVLRSLRCFLLSLRPSGHRRCHKWHTRARGWLLCFALLRDICVHLRRGTYEVTRTYLICNMHWICVLWMVDALFVPMETYDTLR